MLNHGRMEDEKVRIYIDFKKRFTGDIVLQNLLSCSQVEYRV